jgi:serine/threonine protein kinase
MADNEERRSRFEREAKAVAALNHPNIVTIYSVEESEGVHFYTMEYVKGKTLSEMIPSKGMPLNKLFEIAIPLSDAVSTAHERGITHRDLKPDNIMVGEDGRLKILDFGLAKLKQEFLAVGASELPTATATQEGRILGTVAYMSPEQAEGKTIDHRSDIFSLGIILYEVATGRRPFQGDTTASILSSILKDTPDSVTDVNPSLPRDLGRFIKRCLVKDTEHRYQTAKDVRNELEELKQDVDSGEVLEGTSVRPAARAPATTKWLLAVVGVIAIAIVAYLVIGPGPETPETSGLPQGEFTRITSQPGIERFPSLSPDGTDIVYASAESETGISISSVWVEKEPST